MNPIKAKKAVKLHGRLEHLLGGLVDKGYELGVQAAVYLDGDLISDICIGQVSSHSNRKIESNTIFPVCSTGKGISAVLLHVLASRGKLDYDSPVARYWPEYGVNGKASTTVRQALSHQAGIPRLPQFKSFEEICDWKTACAKVAALTPEWISGTRAEYHAITWGWLAGRIAEGAAGRPFMELFRDIVTQPLGIEDSLYFGIDVEAEKRVSKFEPQPTQQEQCMTAPEVYDVKLIRPVPGPLMDFVNMPETRHACIPSVNGMMSAKAIAKVYASMIGRVDGVRLVHESILNMVTTVQTQPNSLPACFGHGMGLGYALKGPASVPGVFFGHGGAGGSEGMANRALGMAFGLTKNRMDTHVNAPGHTHTLFINEILNVLGHEGDGGFYKMENA